MKNPFKRRNKYASPYYGGRGALFTAPATPLRPEEEKKEVPMPAKVEYTPTKQAAPDWEQRRFELVKMLIGQDRRSVVLGKLRASHKQIAATARSLADAAIKELQTHQLVNYETDGAAEETDE